MIVNPQERIVCFKIGTRRIRIDTDPRLLLAFLAFCEKNIIRYFVLVVSMIPVVGIISDFIVPVAYLFVFIAYFSKYGFQLSFKECFVIIFVAASIIVSCIEYPTNAKYILDSNNFWNMIFPCFKYFFIAVLIVPDEKTLDFIGKISLVAILVETLFVLLYMMPNGLMKSDDMSRSYQLLPNILFALNYSFNQKKFFAWICSIVGIIYTISMGTRGPILIILVYIFIKFIQVSSTKMWKKIAIGGIIAGLAFVFLNSNLYISILEFTRNQLRGFGLSTRIIDLAVKGNMTSYMSGRDEIFTMLIQRIKDNPWRGYGVYGEWQWVNWNAHNMALELFIHFGVVLGSFILVWMVLLVVRSYYKTTNKYSKDMILIWACFSFIRGIFGGSWLMYGVFFLIGFCLQELIRVRLGVYSTKSEELHKTQMGGI